MHKGIYVRAWRDPPSEGTSEGRRPESVTSFHHNQNQRPDLQLSTHPTRSSSVGRALDSLLSIFGPRSPRRCFLFWTNRGRGVEHGLIWRSRSEGLEGKRWKRQQIRCTGGAPIAATAGRTSTASREGKGRGGRGLRPDSWQS